MIVFQLTFKFLYLVLIPARRQNKFMSIKSPDSQTVEFSHPGVRIRGRVEGAESVHLTTGSARAYAPSTTPPTCPLTLGIIEVITIDLHVEKRKLSDFRFYFLLTIRSNCNNTSRSSDEILTVEELQ